MLLLDQLALKGVKFPSALFMFRKVLFTLDAFCRMSPEERFASTR